MNYLLTEIQRINIIIVKKKKLNIIQNIITQKTFNNKKKIIQIINI